MGPVTHDDQKRIWEEEHENPYVLPQMDISDPSSGLVRFWDWLRKNDIARARGVEMGCGKGRNGIWLAKQGAEMKSFDYSNVAIKEARKRAESENASGVEFIVHDATKSWLFSSDCFDFGIDCFGSTDIETPEGRAFARDEFIRVLKPGGYLLVYTLSTDDEFHRAMIKESPADEKNAFVHPTTKKFEKIFDREELLDFYKDLKLVKEERVPKKTTFFGKEYDCKHFWMIFQKTT